MIIAALAGKKGPIATEQSEPRDPVASKPDNGREIGDDGIGPVDDARPACLDRHRQQKARGEEACLNDGRQQMVPAPLRPAAGDESVRIEPDERRQGERDLERRECQPTPAIIEVGEPN